MKMVTETKATKQSAKDATEASGLRVHGRTFQGTVVSAKRQKTVKVAWEWRRYIPKYERYERERSVVHAHVPSHLTIQEGDLVKIGETRPISKTKTFVVLEKITRQQREA